jgi:hypothetical protein
MIRRIAGGLLLSLLIAPALAHEQPANRLTIVLREPNHASMTFFINYADALHRALAPGRTFQEFALQYSAMNPQSFQKELLRAQARLEKGTHLVLPGGKEATISRWDWPDAAHVQAALQELVMRAVVAPGEHAHEGPIEVHADATSPQAIVSMSLRLPEELHPVLVVSYRPSQVWIEPKAPAATIRF